MIRLVEAKRGRFLVLDNDAFVGKSLIELGEFCERQAELFDQILKPDAVVVEVGANIGAHTAVLAKRAAYVYAIEPQRRIFNMLCGNMALNALDNVECIRAIASDRDEKVFINALSFDHPLNNFGAFEAADNIVSEDEAGDAVRMMKATIPCDFMKVDVEGHEAAVLRGASDMICQIKPILYLENDRKEKSRELIELVESLGYAAYWHVTRFFRKNNHNGFTENNFKQVHSYDILCLPSDVKFDRLPRARPGEWIEVLDEDN